MTKKYCRKKTCIYPHTIIRNKLLCYAESQKKIHNIKVFHRKRKLGSSGLPSYKQNNVKDKEKMLQLRYLFHNGISIYITTHLAVKHDMQPRKKLHSYSCNHCYSHFKKNTKY